MTGPEEQVHRFTEELDARWCSHKMMHFAMSAGFSRHDAWEIGIAVSELVTNAVKFAGGGTLRCRCIDEPRFCLEISVMDEGPGIEDIETALLDGFSEGRFLNTDEFMTARRGLGTGLGAVKRMMSTMEIENRPTGGLQVVVRKFRSKETRR